MKTLQPQLRFFIILAQAFAKIEQAFDRGLIGGIGFNDFIILYHLSQAAEEKMRRIDLADKIGLTPSGITRMLLPMEKLGMVKREASEQDARVSYVKLAAGGRRILSETLEKAELLSEELLPSMDLPKKGDLSQIFPLFSLGRIGS